MTPTYNVGDVVQIISEEEVRSHPTDDCGNFILIPSIYGANDSFHRDKLPVCGCPAVITRISNGNERNLYDLTPLFAEDRTVFNWNDWFFSAAEFHPRVVSPPPVPSMSFDDLLKGVAQGIFPPTPLAPSFKSFLPQSLTLFPKMMLAVRCFLIPFLMVTQIIYPLNAVLFVAASCKLIVNLTLLVFTS